MQDDHQEPLNQQPAITPPVTPTVSGTRIIQPLSDHIVIDPLPEAKPLSPTITTGAPQAVSIGNTSPYQQPLVDSESVGVHESQSQKIIRRQKIASIIIIVIGLLALLSSILNVTSLAMQGYNGFMYLVYGVQAVFSLGLIFRKEIFRWLVLLFATSSFIITLYFAFIDGLFVSLLSSNVALPGLVILAAVSKLVVPFVIIIFLNLPSVKKSFN